VELIDNRYPLRYNPTFNFFKLWRLLCLIRRKTTADVENRRKALDLALAQIEKQFGKVQSLRLDRNARWILRDPDGSLAFWITH